MLLVVGSVMQAPRPLHRYYSTAGRTNEDFAFNACQRASTLPQHLEANAQKSYPKSLNPRSPGFRAEKRVLLQGRTLDPGFRAADGLILRESRTVWDMKPVWFRVQGAWLRVQDFGFRSPSCSVSFFRVST